jgi:hypothetical protein
MTPSPKNRECQISLQYISFDADSDGGAGGTLCFRCEVVLGRKTGVRRAGTYEAHVRALSREGIFENFRFRPRTSHSTREPTAVPAVLSVFAAGRFLAEKLG